MFFFVDNIAVIFDRRHVQKVNEFQKKLFEHYEMRDMSEIQWFLEIRITRDRYDRKMWLCQDSYIEKIANKFNIAVDSTKKGPGSPLFKDLMKNIEQTTKQEIYNLRNTRP